MDQLGLIEYSYCMNERRRHVESVPQKAVGGTNVNRADLRHLQRPLPTPGRRKRKANNIVRRAGVRGFDSSRRAVEARRGPVGRNLRGDHYEQEGGE
jgi:hypothetical protein